jgi:hypothetical protein
VCRAFSKLPLAEIGVPIDGSQNGEVDGNFCVHPDGDIEMEEYNRVVGDPASEP